MLLSVRLHLGVSTLGTMPNLHKAVRLIWDQPIVCHAGVTWGGFVPGPNKRRVHAKDMIAMRQ